MTSLKTIRLQLECSICCEAFKCDDLMTIIEPCNHHFHDGCLTKWLETKTECPMCRLRILSDYEKSQILRMCVLNRICVWFEAEDQYLAASKEIESMMEEFDIDGVGFTMEDLDFGNRSSLIYEAHIIRDELMQRFELEASYKILDHPLIVHYNKKVYRYVPLTHIIRRHPKPVGIIGGLLNMGKALLGMEY